MMVEPVHDALHAARERSTGIRHAEAHRVAHAHFDGNTALFGKVHQFIRERHHETVKIGARDVFEMAARTNAVRKSALDDAEIFVHRLRAGQIHLFKDMIIGTTDQNARFRHARVLHEFEIFLVGADPGGDLGEFQSEILALFERRPVLVAVQKELGLAHDALFAA